MGRIGRGGPRRAPGSHWGPVWGPLRPCCALAGPLAPPPPKPLRTTTTESHRGTTPPCQPSALLACAVRGAARRTALALQGAGRDENAREKGCGEGELARDRGFGLRAPGAAAMGGHASGCSVRSQRSSGPRARGTSAQCYLGGRLPLAAQADLSARHSLYGTHCEGGCGSLTSSGEAQHLSELKPKSTR